MALTQISLGLLVELSTLFFAHWFSFADPISGSLNRWYGRDCLFAWIQVVWRSVKDPPAFTRAGGGNGSIAVGIDFLCPETWGK